MELLGAKPSPIKLERVSNIQISVSENLRLFDIINKRNALIAGGIIGLINGIQAQNFNYLVTFAGVLSLGIGIALSLKMPNIDQSNVSGESPSVPQTVISQ